METKQKYERALRVSAQAGRNPGVPLDLDWVRAVRVNRSAVERRAATIPTRRTVKKEWEAAWLLRAVTCVDLTTLQGDDTPSNVLRLCAKAQHPVRQDLVEALGATELGIVVGAVCVYHRYVPTALAALAGSGIPVAAVSTGLPPGLNPFPQRLQELRAPVEARAPDPGVPRGDGPRGGIQAGGWDPQRQGGAGVAHPHEGRAGRRVAPRRTVPAGGERPAHRHRAPARALRHRSLLGRAPPPHGMTTVSEIFQTMAYGPAPESDKQAREWLRGARGGGGGGGRGGGCGGVRARPLPAGARPGGAAPPPPPRRAREKGQRQVAPRAPRPRHPARPPPLLPPRGVGAAAGERVRGRDARGCRRADHPVELPAAHGGLEGRPGARRRKHGGERRGDLPGHRSEEHTSELQSPCNLVC